MFDTGQDRDHREAVGLENPYPIGVFDAFPFAVGIVAIRRGLDTYQDHPDRWCGGNRIGVETPSLETSATLVRDQVHAVGFGLTLVVAVDVHGSPLSLGSWVESVGPSRLAGIPGGCV